MSAAACSDLGHWFSWSHTIWHVAGTGEMEWGYYLIKATLLYLTSPKSSSTGSSALQDKRQKQFKHNSVDLPARWPKYHTLCYAELSDEKHRSCGPRQHVLVTTVQHAAVLWKQHIPELSDYQTYLTIQHSGNRAPSLTNLGAEKSKCIWKFSFSTCPCQGQSIRFSST